jgi:hypothetical protein
MQNRRSSAGLTLLSDQTRREFLGVAGATVLGAVAGEKLLLAAETGKSTKSTAHPLSDTKDQANSAHGSVRAIFAFDPSADAEKFAASCREWGIRQAILPPDFFRNDKMVRALAKNGLGVWLNLPVFYNPEYLEQHPEDYAITSKGNKAIHDWCHFVCPSREKYLDKFVGDLRTLLSQLQPEIVSIDFIRHFVFWEGVDLKSNPNEIEDGCYCEVCLSAFEKFSGETVQRNQPAAFIRSNMKRAWGDWKCNRITATANRLFEEMRAGAKNAQTSIKTIPWKESDLDGAIRSSAGQDVARLTRNVDMSAPMAFTQVLGQTPAWKRQLLKYVRQISGKPVLSYLQTDKLIRPEEITIAQFEAELKESLSHEWAGTVIFEYAQLATNPAKAGILTKYLRG